MIARLIHRMFYAYYRRKLKDRTATNICDAILKTEIELQEKRKIVPKVDRFEWSDDVNFFSDGIKFDEPDVLLKWRSTRKDFQKNIGNKLKKKESGITFLGFPFSYVFENYESVYLPPHQLGSCLSRIHFIGPFRKSDIIKEEYKACFENLFLTLGAPAFEQEFESWIWPKHVRRRWDLGDIELAHSISDIKDSDPVNKISIRRKYNSALESRTSISKW